MKFYIILILVLFQGITTQPTLYTVDDFIEDLINNGYYQILLKFVCEFGNSYGTYFCWELLEELWGNYEYFCEGAVEILSHYCPVTSIINKVITLDLLYKSVDDLLLNNRVLEKKYGVRKLNIIISKIKKGLKELYERKNGSLQLKQEEPYINY